MSSDTENEDPTNIFDVKECVGKGNFGDVYRAIDKRNQSVVAIKVVNLEETNDEIDVLVQEISFLSQLKSKYITNYYQTFLRDVNMWIVMEFCGGGSCADLLKCHKRLQEDTVCFIVRETLKGLEYLHSQRKIHRDIKAANILLTENGEIKLADFGVSGQITATHVRKDTFVGTPFWMAPEVILRRFGYNEKADIWSLGITTIELITGSPPNSEIEPMKALFQIPKSPSPLLTGPQYSDNLKEFVRFALVKNPSHRPSATLLLKTKFIRSCKRHVNLVPLIQQKDRWMTSHRPHSKKPKHDLSKNLYTKSQASFKWNFTLKSNDYQKANLIDCDYCNDDYSCSNDPSSSSPQISPPMISPVIDSYCNSSETALTSPESHLARSSNELASEDESISQTAIIHNKKGFKYEKVEQNLELEQINYFNDVILHCFKRVYSRAKISDTKRAVASLGKQFALSEKAQPGLSEALAEEIWLRMCYLRGDSELQ